MVRPTVPAAGRSAGKSWPAMVPISSGRSFRSNDGAIPVALVERAGVALDRFDPEWKDRVLVAVTEKRTRAEMDAYCQFLKQEFAS